MILNHYPHQLQFFDEWCWAAVVSSVTLYYNPSSTWSQPALAAKFIDASCATASPGNAPAVCQQAKDFIGIIKDPAINNYAWDTPGLITINQFQAQINAGWAPCCIFSWGTIRHVVAVIGYQGDTLFIDDPELQTPVSVDYNALLQNGYRGGSCLSTVGTQPSA